MRKESTGSRSESRPEWEQLEDWVRSQVQRLIQELLEEEVTAFLGRAKSALRSDSDSDTGYRNGYGRARRLTLSSGTIQLRRPRVRDTEEQFESRLLNLQRQLARLRLLIIDELGFVPLSTTGAELLFEVFSQRYERGSVLVTTNLPFDEWTDVFGSERLTGALLDRLTHHVHILEMNGDSYRLKHSRQSAASQVSDDPVDS